MSDALQFTLDLNDLEKHPLFQRGWSEKTIEKIGLRLQELFLAEIEVMEREIPNQIPRGATGLLRSSYVNTAVSKADGLNTFGLFGSASPYALYVEEGTSPHWPPTGSLVMWLMRKVGLLMSREEAIAKEYVFRRKIARRGTSAQPIVANWFKKNEARMFAGILKGLDEIFEEVENEL